jgi:hypothetical protein
MVDRKKEEFMNQAEHYRAVLADLQKQRELHQFKIAEIDKAVASLHRLIPDDAKEELPAPNYSNIPVNPAVKTGRFSGMGVRWAVLNLLSEVATGPMSTGEIAAALKDGGVHSEAAKFAGNVSAVLSVMCRQKGEVTASGNGWTISAIGRQAWAHIRAKREADASQPTVFSNVQ